MVNCPECAGELRFDRNQRLYVCTRCGATWSREDLDEAHEKLFDEIYSSREKEEEGESKKRKEYLDWWVSKEKKK